MNFHITNTTGRQDAKKILGEGPEQSPSCMMNQSHVFLFKDKHNKPKLEAKNGSEKRPKSNKKEVQNVVTSKPGGGSSATFLFFIGLSVVIATAAVIFTNESVQMYLSRLN